MINKKPIIIAISALGVSLFVPSILFAQSINIGNTLVLPSGFPFPSGFSLPSNIPNPSSFPVPSGIQGSSPLPMPDLSVYKNFLKDQIDKQIQKLTELRDNLLSNPQINDEAKAQINSSFQKMIDNLNSLKSRTESENNLNTFKNDVQTLVSEKKKEHINALKSRHLSAAKNLDKLAKKLKTLEDKLKNQAQMVSAQGVDTSNVTNLLNDMDSKINSAEQKSQAAQNEVNNIGDNTPTSDSTTALNDSKSQVVSAVADLKTAKQDANNVIVSYSQNVVHISGQSSSSSSATVIHKEVHTEVQSTGNSTVSVQAK